MKKVTVLISIAIMVLIIIGCSNKEVIKHNYVYKGENELWIAEFKVNGTQTFTKKAEKTDFESHSNTLLTITYKNDISHLSSTNQIEISYKTSAGGGSLTETFNGSPPDKKTYTLESSSVGGAIESKHEVVEVSISLDESLQMIELVNVE